MLLTGKIKSQITIQTPKGIDFSAEILDIQRQENWVSCAVIKDGGDDPDVTTGAHIVAKVSFGGGADAVAGCACRNASVVIDGGYGVGRITKPGLDQPVGNAAINHVPREMIQKEVLEVCQLCDFNGVLNVEISVPEGELLAERTFNPRLGIKGGISILGTSGIVEPMSSQALLDTIRVELNQKKALGYEIAAVTPGNYGLDFMKQAFAFDLDKSVKCSNFIGQTIDMAVEAGFKKLLLTGHIGKLVKVSGGIMNTHSKEGDCRMELLSAAAVNAGAGLECVKQILQAVSTEEGIKILGKYNIIQPAMDYLMEKILYFLNKRGNNNIQIECVLYSNDFGLLAKSENASIYIEEIKKMERQ